MIRRFITPTAVALICAAGFMASVRPVHADDTYLVKRTFKAGEVDRYKTTLDIEAAGGMKLQLSFATTEKTREIKDDGAMVRSITVESADIVVNGQTMPMPGFKATTITGTFDKDGKPSKEEGDAGQFRQLLSMTRPMAEADRALKLGEEWKTEVPTNKDGTKKLNVTVTLVSLEPKSDTMPTETYKIKTVAEGLVETPQGDQKVKMESVSLVARDSGKMIKSDGTVSGINMQPFGDAKVVYKVARQPDKAEAPVAK